MKRYSKKFEIRWADLDPNYHVLHSKYYDFGAYCRMSYFVENGLTPQLMNQYHIGPILFREECSFKREILFGDDMLINLQIVKHTENFSRWTIAHEIKKGDIICANIIADGAWIDTLHRKLAKPPQEIVDIFQRINP